MPKYIQIVAPVSAGLILDGSITTAKLAASLDLSGKTITYRSIVNADISATAAIALTKLASCPLSSFQRASGSVSLTGNSLAQEVDVVTITPTRFPCLIIVIVYHIGTAYTGSGNKTYKVTDNSLNILTTGSLIYQNSYPGVGGTFNSLTTSDQYNVGYTTLTFLCVLVTAPTGGTPIRVRGGLPSTVTGGTGTFYGEIEVIS